jgi:hypothetical protein
MPISQPSVKGLPRVLARRCVSRERRERPQRLTLKMSDKELLKQYLEDEKEKKKNGVNEIEIEIKIPMGKKKRGKNGSSMD